jgi:hypothetical protein
VQNAGTAKKEGILCNRALPTFLLGVPENFNAEQSSLAHSNE